MRVLQFALISVVALSLTGCYQESDRDRSDSLSRKDKAAREAGRIAHEAAKDVGKAAATGARELGHAAKEAHEGWKEASQQDKERQKK
jgi:uncharacterized lipoprotein NlpE involved in copper resistance